MKMNLSQVYQELINDNDILKIYQSIEEKEIRDNDWAFHNFTHVSNVSEMSCKILSDLNFSKNDIYKAKIACYLHDVGELTGKEGHALRSYNFAKDYFENRNWEFEGKEEILDSIKNHSDGFDSNSVITLSVILSDKLDIKKSRITEAGKLIVGNRQYAYIDDILVEIKDHTLMISFITDKRIDYKEVSEYYFTHKLFKSIEKFSNKLGLNYKILIDGMNWDLEQFMKL